jgi:hypothetical protein
MPRRATILVTLSLAIGLFYGRFAVPWLVVSLKQDVGDGISEAEQAEKARPSATAANYTWHRPFRPGTKITLKARKLSGPSYFLGENILLDYQVSYDGEVRLRLRWWMALARPIAPSSSSTKTARICRPRPGRFIARGKVADHSVAEIPYA